MSDSIDRVFDQIGHDLGWHDHNMARDRAYSGQPQTNTGARGKQEIRGVTMRDLRDCFIRAFVMSHQYYQDGSTALVQPNATLIDEAHKGEKAVICEDDVYKLHGGVDPIAVVQNMLCEVEKIMGIYPNVPELEVAK